ncbi:MAG: MFS transporter [Hyphomicrobiaceae bacterium]|nr:MFS transporter [Hyphomicrobiaceae bacterium]
MSDTVIAVRQRPGAALAAATVLGLPLGSIYAFSVFLAPLEALLGATRSELASVFGVSVICFTIGMNIVPRLFGRIGVPTIIAISAALGGGGVAIAAVARTYIELAFGYGGLFAFGGGMAYVAAQQSVNATPLSRPGLVNGYLVSLFPIGAMMAAPACGWAIDVFGVRPTLGALAAVTAFSGAVATALMARSGVQLSRPGPAIAAPAEERALTVVFWKLFVVFLMAASAGLMVLSQAAGILAAYGAEKPLALAATTAITAAIAVARIVGGWLVDRLPVPFVAAAAQAIALAGAVLLTLAPSAWMAVPTLGMLGIGYGLISGVTAGAVAFYWPKALFGRTASRVYIAWCLAALVLPVVAARLFDLTGGYGTAIMLAGAANLIGIIAGASLPRARQKLAG